MPKYFYICTSCKNKCSFYHDMAEKMDDCLACGTTNSLKKVPTTFSYSSDKKDDKKIGEVVKGAIEELHSDLEQQKNDLRSDYSESDK